MTQENQAKEVEKILIVDDVDANRFVLRDIIQEMGYQPVVTENGMQALKLISRIRPHLIILDIAMPEMDGYEFCKLMKENAETRDFRLSLFPHLMIRRMWYGDLTLAERIILRNLLYPRLSRQGCSFI